MSLQNSDQYICSSSGIIWWCHQHLKQHVPPPLAVVWIPDNKLYPDTSRWYLSLLKPTRIVGCKAVFLINISKPETYPLRYLQHVASQCVNYAVVSGHGTWQSPTQEVISVPRLTIQKRTVSTHSVTHEVCLWWERQLGFRFSVDTWWSCSKILSSGAPVMWWDLKRCALI